MSEADRRKWDQRYAEGAYAERDWPSDWLQTWLPEVTSNLPASESAGRALDLACGLGRNSRYLAKHGMKVTGVDISAQALERAARLAQAEDLVIDWQQHDLEAGLPLDLGQFQLIVLFRYVNLELLAELPAHLAPGGLLLVEEHLRTDAAVAGPRNPAYRVALEDLVAPLAPLEVLEATGEVVSDPDGAPVALARIAARRPMGS